MHSLAKPIDPHQLTEQFANTQSWEDRYRQLILLSRQLPPLTDELKQRCIEIKGCENRVWLGYQQQHNRTLHFYADSEGRIVRGLLAILLADIQGLTPEQILQRDLMQIFQRLGIDQQLSQSRTNGLNAIITQIKKIALELNG